MEKEKLQEILNNMGFSYMTVIDRDHIQCMVDEEPVVFSRYDRYSGHPLSGWANFGPVGGDHRMIRAIAEDISEAFDLIKKSS